MRNIEYATIWWRLQYWTHVSINLHFNTAAHVDTTRRNRNSCVHKVAI